ncbi:MAG: hypothetical protein H6832_04100 [Planctomycetes bacterium]|nr:hypothetical protein [Planctomycetota bacterium]
MRKLMLSAIATVAFAASSYAQTSTDILYYRFLTGSGTNVINFAPGGPKNGTIVSTVTNPWTTGISNNALRGASNQTPVTANAVDTGWMPQLKDDFTVAWFMQQETAPGTTLSYLFSEVGSFRCFTNGVAGKGLYLRAWGGTPADITTATDIQTPALTGWVHIAFVVDWTKSKTATIYINGKVDKVTPITAGANFTGTTNMFVGRHLGATSSTWTYNTDEFRFSNRAASPGEVAAWAAMTPAGDGAYNEAAACGATLGSNNGPPSIGNATYQFALKGSASSPFALSVGFQRGLIAFDLGVLNSAMTGCQWDSSLDLVLGSATDASGNGTVPLPIPNDTSLAGLNLWSQSVVLVNWQGSNGFNSYIN